MNAEIQRWEILRYINDLEAEKLEILNAAKEKCSEIDILIKAEYIKQKRKYLLETTSDNVVFVPTTTTSKGDTESPKPLKKPNIPNAPKHRSKTKRH
jgi:hypothetical protein